MAYKLLLADDSITIQKVVELTLSEEGFDVTAVGDGEAGLETARKLMPDVILADVFMPKMDGYELCERLKSDAKLAGIPVMLLSGTFEEFDEVRAARVGAADSLTKPFESSELISRVRHLVENRPPVSAPSAPAAEEFVEAGEFMEAEPTEAVDDLWSVVDMASDNQPLAGATEILQEEDLWRRANLLNENAPAQAPQPQLEEAAFEELSAEPMEEAEPFAELYEPVETAVFAEAEPYTPPVQAPAYDTGETAILNMDDIRASVYGAPPEEPYAIEVAEVYEAQEITTFDSLGAATEADEYAAPARPAPAPWSAPSAKAAPAAMPSEDAIRAEVARVAGAEISARVKEALAGLSSEMIERIVWEVVPELAEEIIQKEVDRIKAGLR